MAAVESPHKFRILLFGEEATVDGTGQMGVDKGRSKMERCR